MVRVSSATVVHVTKKMAMQERHAYNISPDFNRHNAKIW